MEAQHAYKKEEPEEDREAELKSPDSGETRTPRRALRGRGATGANPAALPSSPDTNGAGTPSIPGSGRVLRDRSTRSVPLWRRKDLGEEQEEEEEEEEDDGEDEAPRRRKAPGPRRKRNQEAATDTTAPSEKSKDSPNTRGGSRRAQGRSRTPSSRASRASARVVCKSEPEPEPACAETEETEGKKTSGDEKAEGGEDDVVLGEEEAQFADDPKDRTYDPQTQSEDEERVSSDEDVSYQDDLNDQSYDPKSARDAPKQRRRAPARPRDRKEKPSAGEREKEKSAETEVKTEGTDGGDVKPEVGDGADPPRKRGRRRKDDKSPRLPKRRKKPPVQYVRCEMEGCGTVLAHPRYLQHHIKYQHLMKKKYVCPHPSCGRLFRLQKQLLRHAKHHTDQRDYICEFCARAFKSSHNLAVHRMIHTGEKPLQCEICGFTCRQKASLNWHMKKHDADATYQFSCTICGKKFEKKDSVVAHKAKSHPEVLIAEALAANAGTLVTTATAPVTQAGVDPVPVPEHDRSTQAAQAPVGLAPPSSNAEGGGASLIHATSSSNQKLQTVHYVSAPTSQQQQQQVVHMTFTTLNPAHQLPLLSVAHQLPLTTSSAPSISTPFPSFPPHPHPHPHPEVVSDEKKAAMALWEGGNGNMGGVWETGGAGEAQDVTESSEEQIQRVII